MPTKCLKNVEKMSEKCPKLSGGAENTVFGHFFGQFLPIWSMLLCGDPVQCSPVARIFQIVLPPMRLVPFPSLEGHPRSLEAFLGDAPEQFKSRCV